jgi:hypothetical protein
MLFLVFMLKFISHQRDNQTLFVFKIINRSNRTYISHLNAEDFSSFENKAYLLAVSASNKLEKLREMLNLDDNLRVKKYIYFYVFILRLWLC